MCNKYWLSICIPTYNRAQSLKKTIDSIISQKGYDDSIEIVVSDNASTDETQSIMSGYASFENIRYSRNEHNIRDKNFIKVISLASGSYIKLLSDNKPLCSGFIVNIGKAVLLSPAVIFHKNKKTTDFKFFSVNNANEFIRNASFYSTWIPCYSFRKDILDLVNYKSMDTSTQLFQLQLVLDVLKVEPFCVFIVGDNFIDLGAKGKARYNIFKVFIDNYLKILDDCRDINSFALLYEKEKLLWGFIIIWLVELMLEKGEKQFDIDGWLERIVKNYWYHPSLYVSPFYFGLLLLKKVVKNIIIG